MEVASLSSTYMVVSLLGFIASVIYFPKLGNTWGLLFVIMFFMFVVASIISMTHTAEEEDLAIHEVHHVRKNRSKK